MKNLLLFILLCFLSLFAQAQATKHYVVLDSAYNPHLDYSHIVSEYHGYPIEQFNIFLNKNKSMIALLSVLKPFSEKEIQWEAVNLDSIKNQIISTDSLAKYMDRVFKVMLHNNNLYFNSSEMKLRSYYPIIKKDKVYYTPKIQRDTYSLELFSVKDNFNQKDRFYENILNSKQPFYCIDLNIRIVSIQDIEQAYEKKFNKYSGFNINDENNTVGFTLSTPEHDLIRERDTLFNDHKAYRFWTLGSKVYDGDYLERGIERLTYVPEYGIIAGAYTAYFMDKAKQREPIPVKTVDIYNNEVIRRGHFYDNPVKQYIDYDYLHNIQSTPLRIEINGKLMYEKQ